MKHSSSVYDHDAVVLTVFAIALLFVLSLGFEDWRFYWRVKLYQTAGLIWKLEPPHPPDWDWSYSTWRAAK